MLSNQINGVFVALFTPLCKDDAKNLRNSIDFEKAKKIIDDAISAGVDGIVPVGTTGQSATLSPAQHLEFIQFVHEYVNGRVKLIAGAGSNCTRESIDMILEIQKIAPMPVLCVTGYYNNPSREGLLTHFRLLAEETKAPIVLYNVPVRTKSYLDADTVVELAKIPNIIGMKQAVNFKPGGEHREETLAILEKTKNLDFALISGEDDSYAQLLQDGGKGIISATANIPEAAKLYLSVKEAAQSGDFDKAFSLQKNLEEFVQVVFTAKNPIPLATLFDSALYLPLCRIDEMEGGRKITDGIKNWMQTKTPSLLKYQG